MTGSLSVDLTDDFKSSYSCEELSSINLKNIPNHVAIIMDGNRRWAKAHDQSSVSGHWEGAQALMNTLRAASSLGIKTLTVYSFSTENWKRSQDEVEALLSLIESYLQEEKENMIINGIKLRTIGDLSRFPDNTRKIIQEVEKYTSCGDKIELVLALNYGGRDDIRRATIKMAEDLKQGKIEVKDISEETFSSYLDTSAWPDPDLLIRTSGELRLSNFLLWQVSYAEIYITETLWPDFGASHLLAAVKDYQSRDRRLGGGILDE